ncbi:unnamed protein product [Soboliphyme baturini]|uniref:PP1-binding domain-containing protein n=1 Tax=Soboliphyme baturini TaxID=241478 RepID=A0A183IMH5_9BILA|nr:unnamed protein product [Soboliphyme baturini]
MEKMLRTCDEFDTGASLTSFLFDLSFLPSSSSGQVSQILPLDDQNRLISYDSAVSPQMPSPFMSNNTFGRTNRLSPLETSPKIQEPHISTASCSKIRSTEVTVLPKARCRVTKSRKKAELSHDSRTAETTTNVQASAGRSFIMNPGLRPLSRSTTRTSHVDDHPNISSAYGVESSRQQISSFPAALNAQLILEKITKELLLPPLLPKLEDLDQDRMIVSKTNGRRPAFLDEEVSADYFTRKKLKPSRPGVFHSKVSPPSVATPTKTEESSLLTKNAIDDEDPDMVYGEVLRHVISKVVCLLETQNTRTTHPVELYSNVNVNFCASSQYVSACSSISIHRAVKSCVTKRVTRSDQRTKRPPSASLVPLQQENTILDTVKKTRERSPPFVLNSSEERTEVPTKTVMKNTCSSEVSDTLSLVSISGPHLSSNQEKATHDLADEIKNATEVTDVSKRSKLGPVISPSLTICDQCTTEETTRKDRTSSEMSKQNLSSLSINDLQPTSDKKERPLKDTKKSKRAQKARFSNELRLSRVLSPILTLSNEEETVSAVVTRSAKCHNSAIDKSLPASSSGQSPVSGLKERPLDVSDELRDAKQDADSTDDKLISPVQSPPPLLICSDENEVVAKQFSTGITGSNKFKYVSPSTCTDEKKTVTALSQLIDVKPDAGDPENELIPCPESPTSLLVCNENDKTDAIVSKKTAGEVVMSMSSSNKPIKRSSFIGDHRAVSNQTKSTPNVVKKKRKTEQLIASKTKFKPPSASRRSLPNCSKDSVETVTETVVKRSPEKRWMKAVTSEKLNLELDAEISAPVEKLSIVEDMFGELSSSSSPELQVDEKQDKEMKDYAVKADINNCLKGVKFTKNCDKQKQVVSTQSLETTGARRGRKRLSTVPTDLEVTEFGTDSVSNNNVSRRKQQKSEDPVSKVVRCIRRKRTLADDDGGGNAKRPALAKTVVQPKEMFPCCIQRPPLPKTILLYVQCNIEKMCRQERGYLPVTVVNNFMKKITQIKPQVLVSAVLSVMTENAVEMLNSIYRMAGVGCMPACKQVLSKNESSLLALFDRLFTFKPEWKIEVYEKLIFEIRRKIVSASELTVGQKETYCRICAVLCEQMNRLDLFKEVISVIIASRCSRTIHVLEMLLSLAVCWPLAFRQLVLDEASRVPLFFLIFSHLVTRRKSLTKKICAVVSTYICCDMSEQPPDATSLLRHSLAELRCTGSYVMDNDNYVIMPDTTSSLCLVRICQLIAYCNDSQTECLISEHLIDPVLSWPTMNKSDAESRGGLRYIVVSLLSAIHLVQVWPGYSRSDWFYALSEIINGRGPYSDSDVVQCSCCQVLMYLKPWFPNFKESNFMVLHYSPIVGRPEVEILKEVLINI